MLDISSIVGLILNQTFNTKVNSYKINSNRRDWLYFLVDGICPPWSIFAEADPAPTNEKNLKYTKRHERVRKDIERAFGVLIAKFGILERLLKGWYVKDSSILINCCIIMHDMVTEVRRDDFYFIMISFMKAMRKAYM